MYLHVTSYDCKLLLHTTGLKVEFERKQYYMAKNDESVKVCLKKNMTTAKDLIVTVTAKKNKDSQKRETGRSIQGDCSHS